MYYAFILDSAFNLVPPKGSELTWQTSMLYSYTVLLIYVNETIYLFGNLPFFKIYVNHFMARDNSPCANVISKCMWWVRDLMPVWVLRHFLSLISMHLVAIWIFSVAHMVKNLPAMQETWVRYLGQKDPLEKGMTIHSSILVWRIPWSEKPGGPQSMWSQQVRLDWATNYYY